MIWFSSSSLQELIVGRPPRVTQTQKVKTI
jgi:hypothetical protein